MNRAMSIVGLGMVSCLANGSPLNAAAMRCGYDGFHRLDFNQPYSDQAQVGAAIESDLTGIPRLAHMLEEAIREAIEPLPKGYTDLPVLFCLPEKSPPGYFNNDAALQSIVDQVFSKLDLGTLHPESHALWRHRCGFISALAKAQELLHQQNQAYVLIAGLDSLLDPATLAYYGGDLYGDGCRLLSDNCSNGFIPGEAATAVLLSKPVRHDSEVLIAGVGEAEESAVIGDEEQILKGKGLAQAINIASKDAGIPIHETAFRVASVSGEDYFFREASLAQYRALEQKIPEHRLWHPADSIGEVGAAIGGAMVVMVYYAFLGRYAPGNTALCHISNDNSKRGAFIMQHISEESGNVQ
jgi:3-oxoacyl-[acyl-carrier-protein] synthase I